VTNALGTNAALKILSSEHAEFMAEAARWSAPVKRLAAPILHGAGKIAVAAAHALGA
jgi:hypothetical protein